MHVPDDDRTGAEPPSPRSVVAVSLIALAGLLCAWLVPPLAVVLVWPWLFVIPGWVLVRRVAPRVPLPGVVGLAIVTSTYASAHLVDLVSRIDGFDRMAVFLATALLIGATAAITLVRVRWLAPLGLPRPDAVPRLAVAALRRDAPAWILAGAVALIVLVVLGTNGWRETPQGWVSGGWNWSDFLVHVSIGNSIIHGNFPPQVPYVAGEPLTYHWFADFHGAIAAIAADTSIVGVFFVSSALFAGGLALLVWALAAALVRDRRVATIATILVCLGGGFGWIRLVGDVVAGATDIVGLVTSTSYDNSWVDGWPFFRIASIMGTGFLPHRATTLGLPGMVAAVLLVVTCWGRRPSGVLLAGILAALLAPFHFYAFPATYLLAGLFVLTTGAWRSRTPPRDAVLFLAPAVLALPYVLPVLLRAGTSDTFRFVAGWSEARIDDGPAAVAFFYLTNLGLPVVLGVIGLLVGRHLPNRAFLAAWLVALFLVPNVLVVSAVEFDMNKYFQMMWIAAAIAAGWLIRTWPRPAIAAVLVVSAISPALVATWHATHQAVAMDPAHERVARWIESSTPERSVFVTDAFINSPVDLAGRLRITAFGPYVSNLGYDPVPREAAVTAIYCDGPDVAAQRMAEYGATYVLSSGGLIECDDGDPTDFEASPRFTTEYDADGIRVWRLVQP